MTPLEQILLGALIGELVLVPLVSAAEKFYAKKRNKQPLELKVRPEGERDD